MASVPFRLQPRWYRLPPLASRIFLLTSLHAFTLPQESLRRKRRDVPGYFPDAGPTCRQS
ncbi:MAG: hypothetical protein ACRD4C_09015 [Candidatus Acidiferrales bacterium]